MKNSMRMVVAIMGFGLMGMAPLAFSGDMAGDKDTMMDEQTMGQKGMETGTMQESPMEDAMMKEGAEPTMKAEEGKMMEENKETADEMKENM